MAFKHHIDSERCKGCGLCITVCPKNVLEIGQTINSKGHFAVVQARFEDCIHCALCCTICPDIAISISRIEHQQTPRLKGGTSDDKNTDEGQ